MSIMKDNLTADDLAMSDTVTTYANQTLIAGVKVTIGEYTIAPKDGQMTWGGDLIYAVLYDDTGTAVREEGTFVFEIVAPDGRVVQLNKLSSWVAGPSGQTADPTKWAFLPMGTLWGVPGGKLRLSFISDASDILDSTDNLIYKLPVVRRY
jgi:hypothetical protein